MRFFPPGITPKAFAKRFYSELGKDAATDSAAQLGYYFLFSLFPLLVFLMSLTAYLPLQSAVQAMIDRLHYVMPEQAMGIVESHLNELVNVTRPRLLTLGAVVTLWSASRGVDALRKSLNLAYDVTESRPIWKTQGLAILMTVAGSLLTILAFAAFLAGSAIAEQLADRYQFGLGVLRVWSWLRWPFTLSMVMLMAALAYYLLPDVKQRFKFITPGSVFGSLAWVGTTWGFTQYVEHFGRFNVTYGSVGGVVVLMVWLFLSGLILILGGELNSLIEQLSPDGKAKGARREGEPSPLGGDRPAVVAHGAAKSARVGQELEEGGATPAPGPASASASASRVPAATAAGKPSGDAASEPREDGAREDCCSDHSQPANGSARTAHDGHGARTGRRTGPGVASPRSGAEESMTVKAKGLDHVAIAVEDLDRAVAHYRDVLGLGEPVFEDVPEQKVRTAIFGNGLGRIELICPTEPGTGVGRFLEKRGEGLHHVCVEVEDIDVAMAALRASGSRLIDEEPKPGAGGARVAFVHPKGAHGVLTELRQGPPPGDAREESR